MKVQEFLLPRCHLVIDDFFSDDDLKVIWSEILKAKSLMKVGLQGGKENRYRDIKRNKVLVLDEGDRIKGKQNQIVQRTNDALKRPEVMERFGMAHNPLFQIFQHCELAKSAHISAYSNGDLYGAHVDTGSVANLTFVVFLCSEPKKFTGGNLVLFTESQKKVVQFKNNRLLVFPSNTMHEVTKVKMKPGAGAFEDSRFSLQIWPEIKSLRKKRSTYLTKKQRREYFSPYFAIEKDVWAQVDTFFKLLKPRKTWAGDFHTLLAENQSIFLFLQNNLKFIARQSFEELEAKFKTSLVAGADGSDVRLEIAATMEWNRNTFTFGYLVSGFEKTSELSLFVKVAGGKTSNQKDEKISTDLDLTQTVSKIRRLTEILSESITDRASKETLKKIGDKI